MVPPSPVATAPPLLSCSRSVLDQPVGCAIVVDNDLVGRGNKVPNRQVFDGDVAGCARERVVVDILPVQDRPGAPMNTSPFCG